MSRRLLPGLGLAAGVVWLVALTAGSYFTTDDHVYFAQANEQPFGWEFLSDPVFDHFTPWHRLHDHVVSSLTDQGWWLAQLIAAAWYAAAVVAFAVLVRRLVGAHPGGALAIGAFALSPVFVQATQWWALGGQLYPQVLFTLVALIAALRWQERRGRGALVLVWVAYALALLAFIKALLALPLLVLVLYLRPDVRGSLRERARGDGVLWAGLVALTAAYLAVIGGERYYQSLDAMASPTLGLWAKYLLAGWGEGIGPLTLGATVPDALGPGNVAVLVVANLVLAAIVVASVRAARASLRVWAGAAAIAVATLVMSGGARLTFAGVEAVALDPRYNFEGALALLLAGAMAARAAWPRARGSLPAVVALGLLVAVLSVDAGLRRERDWIGPLHRAYFETFSRTLAAAPGVDVIDDVVPAAIVPDDLAPYHRLTRVLPLREPGVRVGTLAGPPATIDFRGRVAPVALTPVAAPRDACAPVSFRVDAPAAEDYVVLSFRRADASAAVDGEVLADTGLPDGHEVRGIPLPAVLRRPLQLASGRSEARLIVGVGATRSIALTGAGLCVSDVRVSRFPLPR